MTVSRSQPTTEHTPTLMTAKDTKKPTLAALEKRIEALERIVQDREAERQKDRKDSSNADMRARGAVR